MVVQPSAVGVWDLARRLAANTQTERDIRKEYTILTISKRMCPRGVRDMIGIQNAWDRFKGNVRSLCCPAFWNFFLPLHHLSSAAIDAALHSAKKTFLTRNSLDWKYFATSKRSLLEKIRSIKEQFWSLIIHTTKIDLSSFNLPTGADTSITFTFVDPIWGWLVAARRQDPLDLHWKPVYQTLNPCYGRGVQYGKSFLQAAATCKPGTLFKTYILCTSFCSVRTCVFMRVLVFLRTYSCYNACTCVPTVRTYVFMRVRVYLRYCVCTCVPTCVSVYLRYYVCTCVLTRVLVYVGRRLSVKISSSHFPDQVGHFHQF